MNQNKCADQWQDIYLFNKMIIHCTLCLIWICQFISSISDDDSTTVISTLWSSYRDDTLFRLVVDRFVVLDGLDERWTSSSLSRRPGFRRHRRRTSSVLIVVRLPCLNIYEYFHLKKNVDNLTLKMHQDLDKIFLFVEM